ncbi:helix-turn-helix transcriptional regulator [Streptomyces sp. NBC_00212]|uniref:helix-turn-helix transcriptional regulator n=1 Tax=Streptomyces sp. NBC_00212 TaxID=2975684 RepID=UPI0032483A18
MAARLDSICRTVLERATDAVNVTDLGRELSHQLARVIPHDGYLLVGLDPASGAGCFHTGERGYHSGTAHRLRTDTALDAHPHPFARLATGPCPVGVLSADHPDFRHSARVHDVMAGAGIISEMRVALTVSGVTRGMLILLREHGSRPFSAADSDHATQLARPLAAALKQFVGSKALRPASRRPLPPAVMVIGTDDRIRSMTPSGQAWLRELGLSPTSPGADDPASVGTQLNMTHLARPATGPAVTRIPTPQGWIVLHAQGLDGAGAGDVAITIQCASAPLLLPAVAAWYGITSRERAVIEQALKGLPVKHIARQLGLSPHTANDHFKAIYRKTGVNSREELVAGLS